MSSTGGSGGNTSGGSHNQWSSGSFSTIPSGSHTTHTDHGGSGSSLGFGSSLTQSATTGQSTRNSPPRSLPPSNRPDGMVNQSSQSIRGPPTQQSSHIVQTDMAGPSNGTKTPLQSNIHVHLKFAQQQGQARQQPRPQTAIGPGARANRGPSGMSGSSFDIPTSECSPWSNDNCCGGTDNGPCSSNPNCHVLREPCRRANLNQFPNPFRVPKVSYPAWLVNYGKVLRFYTFYQEPVPESAIENYRIHQCEIRYFLDDGTIEVYEPKTYDPGFTQGRLIRRHRIPMSPPSDEFFYDLDDIQVGCDITFYGKTFFVTGVDQMTRDHLNRLGRPVVQNMEMPSDPYTLWRQDRQTSLFSQKASINLDQDKFKKFLSNSGKVLRFWAYWDDRCSGGNLRHFLFHYFLEDDTVEIKEIMNPNGSIRGAQAFLNKGKLLKDYKHLVPTAGIREEALPILNTTTGGRSQCHMVPSFMTDRLCPGIDVKEFVTDKDLAIGAVINVYGRAFILTNCDKATQIYYREKYGVDNFTPIELDKSEKGRVLPRMEPPPHIGIGDEVDTLHNWDKLKPTQPKRDELALLVREKDILSFEARFDNALNKVNSDRRFHIKIYMIDNTMQIFEKPHPNTGLKHDQFLCRSQVRRRGFGLAPRFELGETSECYVTADYYVGNILDINGFRFLLTSADNFTLSYMEANPNLFPQANLCIIIDKIKEAVGPLQGEELVKLFTCNDTCLNGVMTPDDFKSNIRLITKDSLNEHELITLIRVFRSDVPKPPPDIKTLQAVIQTDLQRFNFDKYLLSRVEYTFRYQDPCRTGLLDRETLRSTLKGARLPVDRQLIDYLVDHFASADDSNRVNYCELMRFINWIDNGVPKAKPAHVNCVLKWIEPKPPANKVFCVNYRAFLETICPNLPCFLPSICCPEEVKCPPQPFPRLCPDDCVDERKLAGQVISDSQVTPEEFQCQEEDARAGGCINYCNEDRTNVGWTRRDFDNVNPCLLDAYKPVMVDDCVSWETGGQELYRPGDFIGPEDVYDGR